ncbi:MAG: energy-coupling factor transporter transmembrane component T [Litorilinea sp.]
MSIPRDFARGIAPGPNRSYAPPPIHAAAWGTWLAAVVVVLAVTRNPLYLLFTLTWIGWATLLVNRIAQNAAPGADTLGLPPVQFSPLTFGLVVVTLSALFNGLNVHVGTHVLFRLPRGWPLIGGPITAEALLYGALNGLALTGLFAAFVLLNRVVPVRNLVRLAPRAFYPVAVVVTIAVTFVPATVRQFASIREAQAIRGHRVRGMRSWLPLMLPLLIGGMERALQLAEAMMARGFAAGDEQPQSTLWVRAALILGMVALLAGMLLHLVWRMPVWGPVLLLVGALLIGGAVWRMGQGQTYTVYRPTAWRVQDSVICGGALLTALAFLVELPGLARTSALYYPYPALTWPQLDLGMGLSTWGLLPPVFVLLWSLAKQDGPANGADVSDVSEQ